LAGSPTATTLLRLQLLTLRSNRSGPSQSRPPRQTHRSREAGSVYSSSRRQRLLLPRHRTPDSFRTCEWLHRHCYRSGDAPGPGYCCNCPRRRRRSCGRLAHCRPQYRPLYITRLARDRSARRQPGFRARLNPGRYHRPHRCTPRVAVWWRYIVARNSTAWHLRSHLDRLPGAWSSPLSRPRRRHPFKPALP
jgi:hypothetical protein